MRISEAKSCIKALYLHTNSVAALISERGVGKTSAFQQAAEELGIGYIGLYAAALEGPDFMGLPDKNLAHQVTQYLPPRFLPTEQAIRAGQCAEKGILVLEEINRVPSDTISVLYPLLLEKKLNGHQMAEGWSIGVTMNPDALNYMVNALDDAMLDRFIAIEITANLEDYINYSRLNSPNALVLEFLKKMPEMLLVVQRNGDSTVFSKSPTPRGWTQVQMLLNQSGLESHLLRELISGIIGPKATASFYSFQNSCMRDLPNAEAILTDYKTVRSGILNIIEKRQIEWLHYLIKSCIQKLQREVVSALPVQIKAIISNLDAFLLDLPDEYQLMFFKAIIKDMPQNYTILTQNSSVFDKISDQMMHLAFEG
ncbi:AAA family ATPase [Fusibacter ferrireducens]|uniref:AAA family ATPase n=1 Tax=Fusibacter ferrireducens TaxID=2785058 RepID=A0ABR9ZPG0_9FIRM|nr:AAA family ATPase [Fusibacter ferrireducens]MBF4692353.1 AAA family ATPase [Fusibacter ferrireducens]